MPSEYDIEVMAEAYALEERGADEAAEESLEMEALAAMARLALARGRAA